MLDFDTRTPQEPNEPDRVRIQGVANRVRKLLIASRLRTLLIGGGTLLFVVAAVSVGVLSAGGEGTGSGENAGSEENAGGGENGRGPCEGIDPDAIRNGKIAFDLAGEALPALQDPEGGGISEPDIWTVNPNGSDPVNLTTTSRYFDETPAWSPDGRRMAFANRNSDGGRICVIGPDGSEGIEISLPGKSVYEPSWSPDGQTIAFWSPTDGNIFLANADGSGTPERLPTPGFSGSVARPEWSPDGGRIAFEGHGEDSGINIYVMNVSPEGYTSDLRRLTDDSLFHGGPAWSDFRFFYEKPAWSPDGTEIAFATNRNRNGDIYKIDVRSLKVTRLTHSPLSDTQPTWSPDGEHIAYVKQKLVRGTHSSIYKMDSDGSNSTPVFEEDRKYAWNPDWAP